MAGDGFRGANELQLGSAREELLELLRGPFQSDEYEKGVLKALDILIQLQAASTEGVSAGPGVPLVGDETGAAAETGSSDTFFYDGRVRTIPRAVDEDRDVKVSNQKYDEGTYTAVSNTLDPGEEKVVARVNVAPDEFFLWRGTFATEHATVDYDYYIDSSPDGGKPDQDLSGSRPWTTPPDLFTPVPDGFMIVERSVSLVFRETDGTTSYSGVEGALTGIIMEA